MSSPDMRPEFVDRNGGSLGRSSGVSGEIMVAAIVFFLMTVVFVVFIYIYARWRWGPGSSERRERIRRLLFGPEQGVSPATRGRRGLDPAVLQAIPVVVYKAEEFEGGSLECAVCLSEVADGEKARLLPKCNHGFHLECIDMWLHSHSTCPLCRNPIGPQPEAEEGASVATDGYTPEMPNLPTNVLFWGNQEQVSTGAPATTEASPAPQLPTSSLPSSSSSSSSSSDMAKSGGMLVIDIPRRATGEFSSPLSLSPLPSSRNAPTPSRLRSFRSLFSWERRGAPAAGDIEQGGAGGSEIAPPKTPPSGS